MASTSFRVWVTPVSLSSSPTHSSMAVPWAFFQFLRCAKFLPLRAFASVFYLPKMLFKTYLNSLIPKKIYLPDSFTALCMLTLKWDLWYLRVYISWRWGCTLSCSLLYTQKPQSLLLCVDLYLVFTRWVSEWMNEWMNKVRQEWVSSLGSVIQSIKWWLCYQHSCI
jgi:hypothetical protein